MLTHTGRCSSTRRTAARWRSGSPRLAAKWKGAVAARWWRYYRPVPIRPTGMTTWRGTRRSTSFGVGCDLGTASRGGRSRRRWRSGERAARRWRLWMQRYPRRGLKGDLTVPGQLPRSVGLPRPMVPCAFAGSITVRIKRDIRAETSPRPKPSRAAGRARRRMARRKPRNWNRWDFVSAWTAPAGRAMTAP